LEDAIRIAIERLAKKLIERHKASGFAAIKHQRRFKVRTGQAAQAAIEKKPSLWSLNPHFDPTYCIAHSKYLSHTIWRKIQAREYEVAPAVLFQIPKDSGGHRDIMVFSIPDAAVANLFNRKLRDRNRNIQSPFCYSYRKDRTLFDAVLQTSSLLKPEKTYVIQYDFSKYFDSIKHDYIRFILNEGEFFVSPAEKHIIESFITHKYASIKDYKSKTFKPRTAGVPQGCSLSLFLSNIAAHELDKKLEKSNGSFVRFADDIVCVAQSYSDALSITRDFKDHCHYTGITINYDKSPGICLLENDKPRIEREYFIDDGDLGKIETIDEFDYIGHKFASGSIRMSSRGVKRVKARIAKIIYIHMLHNPKKRGLFDPLRVGNGFYDWDLATCLNELRSYIYGGLKHATLKAFIDTNVLISRFKGLMSFYPLVTTVEQFATLDGWLLSVIRRAHRERARILKKQFDVTVPPLKRKWLLDGSWYQYDQIVLETTVPSFVLGWRTARKAFKQYGLSDFEVPTYYSSLFEGPGYSD
jgi:RNA-directed DNA polymerase